MNREIRFYRKATGVCPVEVYLDSLSGKQAQKVAWVLSLIEELEYIPRTYLKKLANTDDIWEVRVNFGRETFRFLGFFDGDQILILAHGFQKETRKIPRRFIMVAEERKRDYFRRKSSE